MTGLWRDRKALSMIGATLICGAAAAVSIALVYPQSVSSPTLGAEWQCHRVAMMTTCTRTGNAQPMAHHVRVTQDDLRRV